MMLKAFVPFIITFALCFIRPALEGNALNIYYGVVCLAFWLCFITEQVPSYCSNSFIQSEKIYMKRLLLEKKKRWQGKIILSKNANILCND